MTSRVESWTRQWAIEARTKEIQYFKAKGVYTKTRREPGMKIIATKWLEVNKGGETNVDIRTRLVRCEFAYEKRDDIFAATPPLESLRVMISLRASRRNRKSPADNFIIMTNDVRRAYCCAPATRPIYIRSQTRNGSSAMREESRG